MRTAAGVTATVLLLSHTVAAFVVPSSTVVGNGRSSHPSPPPAAGAATNGRGRGVGSVGEKMKMMGGGFGTSAGKKKKKKTVKSAKTFSYSGKVVPGKLSPRRVVPDEIMKPDYAVTGKPGPNRQRFPWMIEEKNAEDIAAMRIAGRVAREVLDIAGRAVAPGVTTDEIDRIVHEETLKRGGYPSPLNYCGFPKSCCTSVNEVICHGIPDSSVLKEGDVINVDVTCFVGGYHGDCSEMFCVGEVDDEAKKLIQTTFDSWQTSAAFCKPGKAFQDIGGIIEEIIEKEGFSTSINFCGHGIGKTFHTSPTVLHARNKEPNGIMKVGQTFTIEPMICEGTAKHNMWDDQWTAVTKDGGRSAQFEHTFLVTPTGLEALTGKIETSPVQWWERETKLPKLIGCDHLKAHERGGAAGAAVGDTAEAATAATAAGAAETAEATTA